MKGNFYDSPKNIAAVILLILYCFPVFSFAVGYSGYKFTRVAMADASFYAILYILPAAALYSIGAALMKNDKNASFYRYEKYSGIAIITTCFLVSLFMLFSSSFRSLGMGFWISFVCGFIITFERNIKNTTST